MCYSIDIQPGEGELIKGNFVTVIQSAITRGRQPTRNAIKFIRIESGNDRMNKTITDNLAVIWGPSLR